MRVRRLVVIFCVALFTAWGNSSSGPSQQAAAAPYQALSDKFFDTLRQDKSAKAIDDLFATNPALKKRAQEVDKLKTEFTGLRKLTGRYISHSLLAESKVSGIYVYHHYFVAYELEPISVRITYYKPGAAWVCQSLQFDTKVDDVIRQNTDSNIRTDKK